MLLLLVIIVLSVGHPARTQTTSTLVDDANTFRIEKYIPLMLNQINLTIDPSNVQLIADPRSSSELFPDYEMVYMAHNPQSEIRRITQFARWFRYIKPVWTQNTDIVTDFTTLKYPNKMGVLPNGVVTTTSPYVWWVAAGDVGASAESPLNQGGVYLIDMAKGNWRPIPIVNTTGSGFTHVEWIDMDLDGMKDLVTVVGSKNMNELVWYKQPLDQSAWKMHRISPENFNVGGTDFKLMYLPRDGSDVIATVIVVAGQTSGRLTAYWVDDPLNDWTLESKIRADVIGTDGAYVSVEIVDLNADGRMDVLTSISAVATSRSRVIAYEYPRYGGGKWRKHILMGWPGTPNSSQTSSIGRAIGFHPNSENKNTKPHILVSVAEEKKVYLVSPKSWSPFLWSYKRATIFSSTRRIGDPVINDIDNDGNMEIFIPSEYSMNALRLIKKKM